jgi:hypothetical protein
MQTAGTLHALESLDDREVGQDDSSEVSAPPLTRPLAHLVLVPLAPAAPVPGLPMLLAGAATNSPEYVLQDAPELYV